MKVAIRGLIALILIVIKHIAGVKVKESSSVRRGGEGGRMLQVAYQCNATYVTGFTIVDKEGNVLHTLALGSNGVISTKPFEMVNIRVEFSDGQYLPVESVEVGFNGTSFSRSPTSKCENYKPYTIFGDPSSQDLAADQADYKRYAVTIPYGTHTVFASPFVGNNCCGCTKRYSAKFRIKQSRRLLEEKNLDMVEEMFFQGNDISANHDRMLSNPSSTCYLPQVTGFTIVDKTGKDLATLTTGANGVVFPTLSAPLEDVNIRVEVKSASDLPVKSVRVSFDGSNSLRRPKDSCENFKPYTVFGDPSTQDLEDDAANYMQYAVTIKPGQHTISATAFAGSHCCGCGSESSVTASFSLGKGSVPNVGAPTAAPKYGPTAYPTAAPTKSKSSQEKGLTCIAVIDENDFSNTEAQWAQFRSDFPNRKFCLLQPTTLTQGTGSLYVPADFSLSRNEFIYAKVNRDDGAKSSASDWYSICNLERGRARGFTNVALFVDNSGSMTTATVQASLILFKNMTAAKGYQIVRGVYNGDEDYISPCSTTTLQGE